LCIVPALGQTTVTVSASNVQQDASGTKLAAGYAHFLPVSCATGQPNGFANSGQNGGGEVVLSVTNGAFSGTTADALVANICYRVTITDISGAIIIGPKFYGAKATGYEFVQPTQNSPANNPWCALGVCNFDNYVPLMAPVQLGQWGHITGNITNQSDLVAYIIGNKGTTVWGGISGLLANQPDLIAALALKPNTSSLVPVAFTGNFGDLVDKPCSLTQSGCVATVPILLATDPMLPMQATTKEYSDAETTRAQAAEATKASTTALNSETSRAEAAESSNASAISAETTRAETAESSNAAAITAETTARSAAVTAEASTRATADTVNASAIAAETTRAQAAEATIAPIGAFTDTGSLSAYSPGDQVVIPNIAIRTVQITTKTPWVGCTSPATITLVDNNGTSIISGSTGTTYSAGGFSVDKIIVGSTVTWLSPLFTSAAGCISYATGVQISVKLDKDQVSITPTTASVAPSGTATFDDDIFYASDAGMTVRIYTLAGSGVTWSVDGIVGGNSTVGTISAITDTTTGNPAGLYTAPSGAGTHTITATSNADSTSSASATVTVT
jgi:hypothetical protein